MLIQADMDSVIDELTKELDTRCYCEFQREKKNLEKLKEVLDRRWNESVNTSCIE